MREPYISKLLMPGLWQITDKPEGAAFGVDMYLLEGSDRALLIDAGDSKADLAGFIAKLTDKPIDLVITHGHGDHAAGADQFERVYMSHKDIDILNSIFDLNLGKSNIIDLQGGEAFDLGGCFIEVIAVPGHTPGSAVLLDRERQLLFTSDALGSGTLWMQLPHCTPVEAYAKELVKLEKLVEDMDELKVFVGHDCQRNLGFGKQYIKDVRILAERIISGETIGVPTEDKSEFFGGLSASYGQMVGFIYKPDNIYIKKLPDGQIIDKEDQPAEGKAPAGFAYNMIKYEILKNVPDELAALVEEKKMTAAAEVIQEEADYRIAIISLGEKPTGGYSIEITEVADIENGKATVRYREAAPAPDAMVTQAIAYPYVVLKIEASLPVVFEEAAASDDKQE